jgi:hypothetical protein
VKILLQDRTKVSFKSIDIGNMHSKIAYYGSCFAEHSYRDMKGLGIVSNFSPFGVSYNPVVLADQMQKLVNNELPSEDNLLENSDGIWFSFDHHGDYNRTDRELTLKGMQSDFVKSRDFLESADVLIVSFGTAFVFQHRASKNTVNNCHQQPGDHFKRELIDSNATLDLWAKTVGLLQSFNPRLNIIYTLSPVRHLRDSAADNSLSKSLLRVLIHDILSQTETGHYFPAFELLLDELRDYRYYKNDMAHPSDQAVAYICERFREFVFEDISPFDEIKKYLNRRSHRIRFPETESAKKFIHDTETMKKGLERKYPDLDFTQ